MKISRNCFLVLAGLVLGYLGMQAEKKIATEFFQACQNGDLGKVRECIDKGVEVAAGRPEGRIGLLLAVRHQHKEVAELPAAAGVDINALDEDGEALLHIAAGAGSRLGVDSRVI